MHIPESTAPLDYYRVILGRTCINVKARDRQHAMTIARNQGHKPENAYRVGLIGYAKALQTSGLKVEGIVT